MTKVRIRFLRSQWEPVSGDYALLSFTYEIYVLEPSCEKDDLGFSEGVVTINISGTLQAIWDLDLDTLEKVLGLYAKEYIGGKVAKNLLKPSEELQLSSSSTENHPIFDSDLLDTVFHSEFEVVIPGLEECN